MKIRLLSDLHAEGGFDKELYLSKGEDVLVLAGDINVGQNAVWTMLKQFKEHTPHVVFLSGNHEYYHHNKEVFDYQMADWCKHTDIHFLNPGSVKINDVTFIGGTLWTNFADDHISKLTVPRMINDFRLISTYAGKPFDADTCSALYEEHAAFIKQAYAATEGKKVIVTHFLPDRVCIDKQYQGPDLINNYFANNLGEWITDLKEVPLWMFGHTHSKVDLMIGDTRMIASPYGYGRNYNYKECLIEL